MVAFEELAVARTERSEVVVELTATEEALRTLQGDLAKSTSAVVAAEREARASLEAQLAGSTAATAAASADQKARADLEDQLVCLRADRDVERQVTRLEYHNPD